MVTQTMTSPRMIGQRYQLYEQLGSGGMGAVYRAYDRLTDQIVALKRVIVPPLPRPAGGSSDGDFRLALAREFKMLATLRHPNIISVLDYGFDEQRNPFITMELLPNARPLPEVAHPLSRKAQIRLFAQLLQALTYLHRRGIVHRDLKPPNVLVTADGVVKLLDFGVAQAINAGSGSDTEFRGVAGTLAYMAPEVLLEEAASPASDLYAFGVMAYEILTGKHPYGGSMGAMVMNIIAQKPDVSMIEGDLGRVIEKLLAKKPEDRYRDGMEVIHALYHALRMTLPEEPPSLRESFLRAAQFVGRKPELETLIDALKAILPSKTNEKPKGSLWLIGGESGVGKSRLTDELRGYAMVKGVLVLRGQAVAEGGLPYQLLREPLRRLLLSTPVDDLEAAIIREIFPEMSSLLPTMLEQIPGLEGRASQERFVGTVVNIVKRACAQQPILVVLEDLHWSDDNFPVLKALENSLHELPMLILGTYRVEERPSLPQELPTAKTMLLSRLNTQEIAVLSEAMLGEVGRSPQVLDLLRRETEGNAFFLVEVVRALAEDTGRLEDIGSMTLPAHVLTGGVRSVIAQRLARVPAKGQKLLQLAAVAGRELDLRLMERFVSEDSMALETWLAACSNAAVLEVIEGQWRFAHDKLREAALAAIPLTLLKRLHQEVAEALEALYPDSPKHAAALAHHWHVAENGEKEAHYERAAGDFAERLSVYPEAAGHFRQALRLTHDPAQRAVLLLKLGAAHYQLAEYGHTTDYLTEALKLARALDLPEARADALLLLATVLWRQGKNAEARRYAEECLEVCRAIDYRRGEVLALVRLGMITFAVELLEEGLALARQLNDPGVLLVVLNNNGVRARVLGRYAQAIAYHEEQAALAHEVGSQGELAYALNNLANIYSLLGDFDSARNLMESAIELHRTLGQRAPLVDALLLLGAIHTFSQNYSDAERCITAASGLAAAIDYHVGILEAKAYMGDLAYHQGDYAAAENYYSAYLADSLATQDENHAAAAAVSLGHTARRQGEMQRAQDYYRRALRMMPRRVEPFMAHVTIGFAGTMDDYEKAALWLGSAMNVSTLDIAPRREGEFILEFLRMTLTPGKIETAFSRGKTLDLNTVVDQILS